MTDTEPALADGVVRVTIEAESEEVARRAGWALGRVWEATGPTEPAPMPGAEHVQVWLYARPPSA